MERDPDAPTGDLEQIKAHARSLLLTVDGVQGVGLGSNTIRVYVRDGACGRRLPDEVDGVPVEPVVVGVIRAQ